MKLHSGTLSATTTLPSPHATDACGKPCFQGCAHWCPEHPIPPNNQPLAWPGEDQNAACPLLRFVRCALNNGTLRTWSSSHFKPTCAGHCGWERLTSLHVIGYKQSPIAAAVVKVMTRYMRLFLATQIRNSQVSNVNSGWLKVLLLNVCVVRALCFLTFGQFTVPPHLHQWPERKGGDTASSSNPPFSQLPPSPGGPHHLWDEEWAPARGMQSAPWTSPRLLVWLPP